MVKRYDEREMDALNVSSHYWQSKVKGETIGVSVSLRDQKLGSSDIELHPYGKTTSM